MAKKAVFLDTSGFFSWLSANDERHDRAVKFFTSTNRVLITTDWIIAETCNLFVARRAPQMVRTLFRALDESVGIQLIAIDSERFREARSCFLKCEDHAFPLTDCSSFVVMRELGITDALTADRHFHVMGFNPLLAS